MKRHFSLFVVGLVTAFSPLMVNGQVSISIGNNGFSAGINIGSPQDFYQPLSSLGTWVNLPQYGRCWHPSDVSADWQPYAYGQWVWTDAGWYWQSDEPWAWATYHYGSWVNNPSYGWCWIPGTEWAPAWVTWREGPDYLGWAPCGPNETVLGPQYFLFTGIHDFGRHFRGRGDFVRNDRGFINRTRVINDFSTRNVNIDGREKRISYNRGPNMESIQRATGKTFHARPVTDVIRERHQPANMRQNRNNEQRPGTEQQRNHNEQQGIPPSSQERNQYQRPGQHPETPQQQRQPEPTGREHGINTPQEQNQHNQHNEQPNQPNRYERPGQPGQPNQPNRNERPGQNVTPGERQVPPTGQEHGISTPPQQREVPTPNQPNRNERPGQNVTPGERQVPPTGQEHGISTPPQQREVPTPSQPNRSERPMPQQHQQVPPTGQEHGISTPPQQREVPTPSQPNRTERPTPQPMAPHERQASPTGQEHGISTPPQQHEVTRPAESQPKSQPAPRQERPAQQQQPQQHKQDGNQ